VVEWGCAGSTDLRYRSFSLILLLVFALSVVSPSISSYGAAGESALGDLSLDGPPTPEQIALYLPVTGVLEDIATARVRYRAASGGAWIEAHPLYRLHTKGNGGKQGLDAFAGVITGVRPGVSYEIKVSLRGESTVAERNLVVTTRSLPGSAGRVSTIIRAGSTSPQIQKILDSAKPGDVIEFENGNYVVDNLKLKRGGTLQRPIFIRGKSRTGVMLKDSSGIILNILGISDVIIENLTLLGSNTDSGTRSASRGINFWNGGKRQERITIRNVIIRGVDMGIVAWGNTAQLLAYDNILKGNNIWDRTFLESNLTWNDDGIRVPGKGNSVFNNTLMGFGDALAVSRGVKNISVHFYRNDIQMTGDDAFEADYGHRNITFYDNRVHNSMTLISVDPIYGGPLFAFRNIAINVGRQPYKLNNRNSGFFLYNNTVVRTNGFRSGAGWAWAQPNNGPLTAWGYRNNILIYRGAGNLLAMEPGGQNPIDFDHNAWYPDGKIWWTHSGGCFSSLMETRSRLPATTSLFGESSRRHEGDVISGPNPFKQEIELGEHYLKEIVVLFTPKLAHGTAPRGAGAAIPGITDGFAGTSPDIGALITGRPIPHWGDRSLGSGKASGAEGT